MKRKSISQHIPAHGHPPQRTCVACRTIKAKRELIRLVCAPDGNVETDLGGKKPGRGVYLCPIQECWQLGLKSGRLEYALRTSLAQANRDQLIKYSESLAKGNSKAGGS